MMFSVPQFIDVEDKIAGPLTWRQLLWMIGLLVTLLMIYTFVGGGVIFVIIALPLVLAFSALAFYRPQGQSLLSFVGHGFFFLFRPKVAVWERPVVRTRAVRESQAPAISEVSTDKGISRDRLRELAKILDQGE